jgi:hypothetical protein
MILGELPFIFLGKEKTMEYKKNCLFCVNSLSADTPDGSQVLCCFNVPGYEGSERWVDEEYAETCENWKEN